MSVIEQAKTALQGVTPGPWVFNPHEESDYDEVTVGAGTYLESPGNYLSTDLIHEVDTYSLELDGREMAQVHADARFIAAARTLVPALASECGSWCAVAATRQDLIDQLKAEKRQLQREIERLTVSQYCLGCGGAFRGEHDCGRKR